VPHAAVPLLSINRRISGPRPGFDHELVSDPVALVRQVESISMAGLKRSTASCSDLEKCLGEYIVELLRTMREAMGWKIEN
jgi:hypothetical protein